jgi:hypothetical protein
MLKRSQANRRRGREAHGETEEGTQEERDRQDAEIEIKDGNMDWVTGSPSQEWTRGSSAIKMRTWSTSRNPSLTEDKFQNHSQVHKQSLKLKTNDHWNRVSGHCHSLMKKVPGA